MHNSIATTLNIVHRPTAWYPNANKSTYLISVHLLILYKRLNCKVYEYAIEVEKED